jgi:hypothetical protein
VRGGGPPETRELAEILHKSAKQSSEMYIDPIPAEYRMWMQREEVATRNEGTRKYLAKSAKQSSEM